MKFPVISAVLVVAAVASAERPDFLRRYIERHQFEVFKRLHSREYATPEEESQRRAVFLDRLRRVAAHNANPDRTYSQTAFHEYADWTEEEMVERKTGFRADLVKEWPPKNAVQLALGSSFYRLPKHVDWNAKGAVTPVKNQGHCGSCWTFSATGALEGRHFLQHGELVSFSEQQLLDCTGPDTQYKQEACDGGNPYLALQYVHDVGGLEGESDYPYLQYNKSVDTSSCHFDASKVRSSPDDDAKIGTVEQYDEEALQRAVATQGPVSVGIYVMDSFMDYAGGVYHNASCSADTKYLNHGVLVAGYGHDADSGLDYWLVKNSWGAKWGDRGYVKMARNVKANCGIADMAVYPI